MRWMVVEGGAMDEKVIVGENHDNMEVHSSNKRPARFRIMQSPWITNTGWKKQNKRGK